MNLIVENLVKSYDKKDVLKNISFKFESGKIYGLLGINGSGKTTFFDILNSDVKKTSGKIYFRNQEKKISVDNIGYVKSIPMLPDFLTAREFVSFYLGINSDKIADIKDIDEYFDDFYIEEESRDMLLKDFSHGMKNKILMLVNFVNNPDLLLLDEPLTSFDPLIIANMKQKLKEIKKDKIIILSTHIMEIALDLCDEIILIKDGNINSVDNTGLGKVKTEKLILKKLKGNTND